MSWLTSRTSPGTGTGAEPGTAIDIPSEAALCNDLNTLASATQAQLQDLGAADVFALLRRVASGDLSDAERALLYESLAQWALSSSLAEQVARKLFSPLGEPPQNAHLLLQKLSDFNPGGKSAGGGAVDWEMVSLSKSAGGGVADISMEIGGTLGAMLSLRAAATLPDEQSPTPNLGQVGREGSLEVSAQSNLPLPWPGLSGSLGGTAQGKGRVRVDYYSLHRPEQRFLQAVGEDLRHLVQPWDLQALQARFRAPDAPLRRLRMEASGSFGVAGTMTLAKGADFKRVGTAQAQMKFDASLRVSGDFLIDCMPGTGDRVRVDLRRRKGVNREQALTVGVQVGFGSLMERVKGLIAPHLGTFEEAFEMLGDFLDGKGPIADVVDEVEKKVGLSKISDETRAALAVTFGFMQGDPAQSILQIVKDELPMVAGFWDDTIPRPTLLARAKAEVMARLGPLVSNHLPEGKLDELLEQAIAAAQPRLKEYVQQAVTGTTSARWFSALRNAGAQVSQGLDSSLAAAKKLLEQFRSKLGQIRKAVESVANAQLSIEIAGHHSSEREDDLMLSVELDPASEKARAAFRHFMIGSLDSLANVFEQQNQQDVRILDGYLQSVRRARRAHGFKVILADLALGSESVFSSEVQIRHTLAGIEVMTRASYEQRKKLWRNLQSITFINALHVAAAAETRTMAASLTLSHAEDALAPQEAERFLRSLERADLLAPGTAQRAAARLREAIQKNNADVKGQLDVTLLLGGRHLNGLLNVVALTPVQLGPLQASLIGETAIHQLVTHVLNDKTRKAMRDCLDRLQIKGASLEDRIAKISEKYVDALEDKLRGNGPAITHPGDRELLEYVHEARAFRRCAELLIELVKTLRELYASTPGRNGWTTERYEQYQDKLDHSLPDWLRMYPGVFAFLLDKVHPYTVAFLASLFEIIERNAGTRGLKDILQASITITLRGNASQTLLLT